MHSEPWVSLPSKIVLIQHLRQREASVASLFLGVAGLHFRHARAAVQRNRGDGEPRVFVVARRHLVMVEHRDLHIARLGLPVRTLQVTVDFLRGLLAVGHRTDDEARAKGDVARGENAGRRGFERVGIDLHRSLPRGLNSVLGLQEREVGGLPDGQDRGIDIENALRSGLENRIEAVLGVEYRCAVNRFEPRQLPVLTDKPPGAARRVNFQAFVEGLRQSLPRRPAFRRGIQGTPCELPARPNAGRCG